MKKLFSILIALMLLASAALAQDVGLTNFETTDAQGNTVTEEIFAPYDLTMVNVWATWCGYCIEEMPAFQELKNALPENVNLITICEDFADDPELVQQILETTGATNFPTLVPSPEMYEQLLGSIYSFPTTFFMDSKGEAVGYIEGVPSLEDPAGAYLEIINEALKLLEDMV